MTAIDYALTDKKLKVWHSNGQVSVFQDGADVDGDATSGRQYDNFWQTGTNIGSVQESTKIGIRLGAMEFGVNSPASFSFQIHDRVVNSYFDIDLNDIVEFWAEVGPSFTPSIADFPSWHLNEQSPGQVRLFRGKVVSKSPIHSASSADAFEVSCEDPRAWADDVTILRDIENDIQIPHLIINAEVDEKAWMLAVKKTDAPTWPTHPTYTHGVPTSDGGKLTVRDALAYLNDYYASELTAAGVKEVGVDIFHDDDLEPLTTVLPKLDFVQVGFYEAAKRILEFAPDYSLTIDPKTTQWRIFPSRQLIVPGERALTTDWVDLGSTVEIDVSDATIFSTTPGDRGNWFLMVDALDSRFSIYVEVQAKAGATITINNPGRAYPTGSKLYPMESFDVQLPVIPVDLKSGVSQAKLDESLDGVYTAVRITAFNQTTSERTVVRSTLTTNIIPAWDAGFEANWNSDKKDREEDRGKDGLGIILYKHTLSGGGKSILWFLAANSQYGADHDFVGAVAEWLHTAVKFTWQAGVDASQDPFASRIDVMVYDANIDGAGHAGFRLTLAHDLTSHPAGPGTIYTTDAPGGLGEIDRFKMSHDQRITDLDGNRAAMRLNANFEVGKKWALSETLMEEIQASLPGCGVSAQISGLAGVNAVQNPAYNPLQGGPPRTWDEINTFWTQRVGAGNFLTRGFFLKQPATDLAYSQCSATNPPEPPSTEIKYILTLSEARQVRIPASGFGGLASAFYGLERELSIQADRFTDDSQEAIYEDIAESIFRDVSEPHHSGSLELLGIKPWLNLADLVCRVQLRNDDWTYHTAQWNYLGKFRAPLSRVSFDFGSLRTNLQFARRDLAASLDGQTLEDLYVKEPEKVKEQKDTAMTVAHAIECLNKPQPANYSFIPGCRVINDAPGGGPGRGGGKPAHVEPKEEGQGTNESSVGLPIVDGGAGKFWVNKGPLASGMVERDHLGNLFLWSGMGSQAMSESGSEGALLSGSTLRYTAQPQVNQARIKNISKALFGATVDARDIQTHAKIGSGSTTTVIEIAETAFAIDELAGGTVEIIGEEDKVRPIYPIVSNDAGSITLASAMSEDPPAEGAVAVVRGPGLYPLDPTDFPDGGTAIMDTEGNWFVFAPDGTIVSAQVVSGVLEEKTSSPNSPILDLGQSGLTLKPKGDIDFSDADSVSGLATSSTAIAEVTKSWVGGAGINSPRFWNAAEASVSNVGFARTAAATGTTTVGYKFLRIPEWAQAFDGSTEIYIDVYWVATISPGASLNWVLEVRVKPFDLTDATPGSGMTALEEVIPITESTVLSSVQKTSIAITTPALFGGEEFVNFSFKRLADDASDDYAQALGILGFDVRSGVKTS